MNESPHGFAWVLYCVRVLGCLLLVILIAVACVAAAGVVANITCGH